MQQLTLIVWVNKMHVVRTRIVCVGAKANRTRLYIEESENCMGSIGSVCEINNDIDVKRRSKISNHIWRDFEVENLLKYDGEARKTSIIFLCEKLQCHPWEMRKKYRFLSADRKSARNLTKRAKCSSLRWKTSASMLLILSV